MISTKLNWRIWVAGGFAGMLLFIWFSEIADLPHFLLRAPRTPINWQESLLESAVILIATAISWVLISRYERGWQEALDVVRQLANTDDLTGILNRRECLARSEAEFSRSLRFGRPFTLALIDFDNFKTINDLRGHQVGDQVIQLFARAVQNNIRAQDVFGRLGGDEFLLVCVETFEGEALQVLERIREQWRETATANLGEQAELATVSVGMATVKSDSETLTHCIRRADQALYLAKSQGRDQVQKG